MDEEHANDLRFSIEESVWLDKEQGIDEILSLSLEPDISVVENKHYVSVRGALKLTGEFRPLVPDENTETAPLDDDLPLSERAGSRTVEKISMSDDGTAQIEHPFPVDITIPLSRIDDLEDIYVKVNAFDYTLPENNCIRLDADVSITGMLEEEPANQIAEPELETARTPEPEAVEGEIETEESPPKDEVFPEETSKNNSDDHVDEAEDTDSYEPFHYEAVRTPEEYGQDEADVQGRTQEERGPLVEMKSRAKPTEVTANLEADSNHSTNDSDEERSDEYAVTPVETTDEEAAPKQQQESASYLTKMMTNDEEEFSRLKMCIIQPGESLEKIAKRYDLTLSQLTRVNRLESEDVEEGQILYIPVSV